MFTPWLPPCRRLLLPQHPVMMWHLTTIHHTPVSSRWVSNSSGECLLSLQPIPYRHSAYLISPNREAWTLHICLWYWNPCRCCWCNLATVFVVLSSFYVCSTWLALVQPGSECATENGPSQPRSLGITWCDDCLLNCITIVQVGWNKCGESWMQGYCSLSCGRCPSGESYISPTLVLWTLLAHNVSKLHIFDANGAGIPWHECLFLVLSFVVYQTPSKPPHEWKACYDHTEKSKHLMHCSR